jgi:hypothetical protein
MSSHRATRWLIALASIACMAVIGSIDGVKVSVVPVQPSQGLRTPAQMGELVATSRVCQSLIAQYNGLARVEVRLTDQGREASGPFHFWLGTAPDAGQALVSLTYDASEVNSDLYTVRRLARRRTGIQREKPPSATCGLRKVASRTSIFGSGTASRYGRSSLS